MDRPEENEERTRWQKIYQYLLQRKEVVNIICVYLPILADCVICLSYVNQVKDESLSYRVAIFLSLILFLVCIRTMCLFQIFLTKSRSREGGNYESPLLSSNLALGRRINVLDEINGNQNEHEQSNRNQEFHGSYYDPPTYDVATSNPPTYDFAIGNPPTYGFPTGNPPNYDMEIGNPPNYDPATANQENFEDGSEGNTASVLNNSSR